MNFLWPQALSLFILVPLYIFLYFYFEKKKANDIVPFGNLEFLAEAISKTKRVEILKHLPFILKVFLFCALIFALARPTSTVYLPMRDTKVMLLIDNSISMEAPDIHPNRIFAAKEAAKHFIDKLPQGVQIGIALFSGNVKVPLYPTLDKIKAIRILDKINLKLLEPGTAIGDAILAGIDAITFDDTSRNPYANKNNRILVLITDGEANIGADPIFAAAQAKVNNITIQAIGIGNPSGTIIRGGILTRLDEFTLQEITALTKGYYFNAQNLEQMKKIYKKIRTTIKLMPQQTEITFIPVIISFVILFLLQVLKWSKFRFA